MPRRPPRPALAAALILAAVAAESRAATEIRWKFREGQVLHYTMVQAQSMTSKVTDPAPQEIKQGFNLTIDQTWTVKAVDPSGAATLTQSIDRIRTTAELPTGPVTFDSAEAKDRSGPAGPLFDMLVGSSFTFRMDPRGEISDIRLPERMLATLRGEGGPAGAQGQFSEVGLKNMVAQMGLLLPPGPVDAGATWSRKASIPAGPDGQTRGTEQSYAYHGPRPGGIEAIDLAIAYDPPKPDPAVPVTIQLQESKGRFDFDNAAGRLASSAVTEKIELVGTIAGKEIRQAGQTTTTMKLLPDAAR